MRSNSTKDKQTEGKKENQKEDIMRLGVEKKMEKDTHGKKDYRINIFYYSQIIETKEDLRCLWKKRKKEEQKTK